MPDNYDDIKHLTRPQYDDLHPMSMSDRAAQFSPFAALFGYGDAVAETARLTEAGFKYQHRHIAFNYLSHAMLTELPTIYKLDFKTERRNPQKCRVGREKLKKVLLDWVENVCQI